MNGRVVQSSSQLLRKKILNLRVVFVCAALVWVGAAASLAAVPTHAQRENFERVACATFKISGAEYECGYVRVPEYHAALDGAQLRLAVAILPSPNRSPTRDAFVVAQGGPGGSTLDSYASFFQNGNFPAIETLRAERDIVLYDQRGTLYAQPALTCPEELALTLQTIEQELAPEESLRQQEQAALQCRDRLAREGIHLDAYNSFENARDIEDVRRALGYEKFDFYGVSYGTLLALHGLRETPETFRSVVLDAVVPAQINPNSQIAVSQNRAFEELFTRCAADADCNRAYPNLKQVFYAQVDALNQSPARIPLTDRDPPPGAEGKTYNAVINGDDYMDILFQFIYNTELVPALPQMLYDARAGRYTLIEAFYPVLLFDRTFASGMYYSVMCAEDVDFVLTDLALAGVDVHIARAQTRDTAAFIQLCQKWNVPQLGAAADEPVKANVPTLIFSGDLDPITPPPNGSAAAENITPSYVYEFPAYGHGAMTNGDCPLEIIAAFVENPERAPNAQCIAADATRVNFITPSNYVLAPGIGKMQFAMLQGNLAYFIVPLVWSVILLSVWLIAPLAWLVRRSRHLPSEAARLARALPWLAALLSLLAPAFFVIVFVLVLVMALQNENIVGLLVGAPRVWTSIYILPFVFALGAVAYTLGIVVAWQRGYWSVWLRAYFSLLAFAALALSAWFAWTGLMFAFLS